MITDAPSLRTLDISNNEIEDSGVGLLCENIQRNKSLTVFWIWGCELSKKGIYYKFQYMYLCIVYLILKILYGAKTVI